MRKIYIIGTIHNMLPKDKEDLKSILEKINPNQVLVEIVKKDLKNKDIRKYPKEMIYAYRWGIQNKKKVDGFDVSVNVVKQSITKKELKDAERKIISIADASGYTWRDFNKPRFRYIKEIDELIDRVIDHKKDQMRQKKMLKNIHKMMIKDGAILILTGAGHLDFFEKNMKGAIFPLKK